MAVRAPQPFDGCLMILVASTAFWQILTYEFGVLGLQPFWACTSVATVVPLAPSLSFHEGLLTLVTLKDVITGTVATFVTLP